MFSFMARQFKKLPKWMQRVVAVLIGILLVLYLIFTISRIYDSITAQSRIENAILSAEVNSHSTQKNQQVLMDIYKDMAQSNQAIERYVQFIDVGQGDCTLVVNKSEVMLIDAGNNEDGELIVSYLRQLGITKIDYLVGTHPHEDHIGGIDDVIESFDIGMLILPDVSVDTYTYEEMISAANENNVEIYHPAVGEQWGIGDATCTVLSNCAVEDLTDLNEWSLVIHLDTNKLDFLFMGDAQICNENAIINSGFNFKADVLRVSHHGSSDANSEKFICMVDPTYSVISVGADNEYNHPHTETFVRLYESCKNIARTDKTGTYEISFSGNTEIIGTSCDGNKFEKQD